MFATMAAITTEENLPESEIWQPADAVADDFLNGVERALLRIANTWAIPQYVLYVFHTVYRVLHSVDGTRISKSSMLYEGSDSVLGGTRVWCCISILYLYNVQYSTVLK